MGYGESASFGHPPTSSSTASILNGSSSKWAQPSKVRSGNSSNAGQSIGASSFPSEGAMPLPKFGASRAAPPPPPPDEGYPSGARSSVPKAGRSSNTSGNAGGKKGSKAAVTPVAKHAADRVIQHNDDPQIDWGRVFDD